MSEYQYFEFLAIDRPLSPRQQAEVRALSSRARITSTRFVNEYHWGDFRGDPKRLMERYYDAHLYLANWGTQRVMVRLPQHLLDLDVVADYVVDERLTAWVAGDSIIVDFVSEAEPDEFEFEPEASLADIVGVRAELAAGDLRPLYLGWLAAWADLHDDDDFVDAALEPPVPPGLATLTTAQVALAEFLRVDEDLLAIAAEASPRLDDGSAGWRELSAWVASLPVAEKDRALERVVQGEGDRVRAELLSGFRAASGSSATTPTRRTLDELSAAAQRQRADRDRQLAARRADDQARREAAVAAARDRRLNELAGSEDTAWERVDALIATRKPADYDAAVAVLADLHALADREHRLEPFASRVAALRSVHQRKTSLTERLDRAGLGVLCPSRGAPAALMSSLSDRIGR